MFNGQKEKKKVFKMMACSSGLSRWIFYFRFDDDNDKNNILFF